MEHSEMTVDYFLAETLQHIDPQIGQWYKEQRCGLPCLCLYGHPL